MMIELFKDPVAWHVGSYAMFVVTEILLIPFAALQDSLKKADEDGKDKSKDIKKSLAILRFFVILLSIFEVACIVVMGVTMYKILKGG